jgi:hypothetical protein
LPSETDASTSGHGDGAIMERIVEFLEAPVQTCSARTPNR